MNPQNTPVTRLDEGVATASSKSREFNKPSALRDLGALSDAVAQLPERTKADVEALDSDLVQLATEPDLLAVLDRWAFIERGIALLDGRQCPLCDHTWPEEKHLREHLGAKLAKSTDAKKIQTRVLARAAILSKEATKLAGLIDQVQKLAGGQGEAAFEKVLTAWKADLDQFRGKLTDIHEVFALQIRLSSDWLAVPRSFGKGLAALTRQVEQIPDQTTAHDAQTFLATAQLRLSDYREAMRKNKAAELAAAAAKVAYDTYCTVMEDELQALYEDVQDDFSTFYRDINGDDEGKFTAKLTPSAGKLDFDVNFYERGLFPPGAFHSEGHQDGMGVCLYLALMKRLVTPA